MCKAILTCDQVHQGLLQSTRKTIFLCDEIMYKVDAKMRVDVKSLLFASPTQVEIFELEQFGVTWSDPPNITDVQLAVVGTEMEDKSIIVCGHNELYDTTCYLYRDSANKERCLAESQWGNRKTWWVLKTTSLNPLVSPYYETRSILLQTLKLLLNLNCLN